MKRNIRVALLVLLLISPAVVGLLSGCSGRGTSASLRFQPPPVPTMDPHRLEPIEDWELNWSYWPDVVKTPVFGDW
ncbi:MAG: hypothetical protein WCP22_13190 [Chlamydiota bacterium]